MDSFKRFGEEKLPDKQCSVTDGPNNNGKKLRRSQKQ